VGGKNEWLLAKTKTHISVFIGLDTKNVKKRREIERTGKLNFNTQKK
jgi:hypothetical protein